MQTVGGASWLPVTNQLISLNGSYETKQQGEQPTFTYLRS